MKMKKIAAAALAAALALSLTACGDGEKPSKNNSGTNTPQSGGETTQTGSNSTDNSVQNDEKEPADESNIWDVLPEIPVTDASAFKYEYDSELGGMVITDYLEESPKVRIPDKLEGEPVVKVDFITVKQEITQLVMPNSVKDFKLSYTIKNTLQYVNIPNSVTEIGRYAFNDCTSLTSVAIPNSVTEIGLNAFHNCTSLTNVTIPDSVTEIGNYAFRDCTSLTSVYIGNSVTKIGIEAFYNCSSLTSITIPDSMTYIGYEAFKSCENIQATYKGKTYDYRHIDDLDNAVVNH